MGAMEDAIALGKAAKAHQSAIEAEAKAKTEAEAQAARAKAERAALAAALIAARHK